MNPHTNNDSVDISDTPKPIVVEDNSASPESPATNQPITPNPQSQVPSSNLGAADGQTGGTQIGLQKTTPQNTVLPEATSKAVRYFGVACVVTGILQLLLSVAIFMGVIELSNGLTKDLLFLFSSIIASLLLVVPGFLMTRASQLKAIQLHANIATVVVIGYIGLSLLSGGGGGGLALWICALFSIVAQKSLRKIKS